MVQLLWRTVQQLLKMLSIGHYPEIPLLGINQKELKTCLHKNWYTDAHSRNIHKTQNNPKVHPLKNE